MLPAGYSYTHACLNEAHSLANLQDLISTLSKNYGQHTLTKCGIKSCGFAREVSFVHAWMQLSR